MKTASLVVMIGLAVSLTATPTSADMKATADQGAAFAENLKAQNSTINLGIKDQSSSLDATTLQQLQTQQREINQRSIIGFGENIHTQAVQKQVEELAISQQKTFAPKDKTGNQDGTVVYVFLSYGMGLPALQQAYQYLDQNKDIAVGVFNGLPAEKDAKVPETNITKGIARIQAPAKAMKITPNLQINPTLFEEFAVKSVPTMVLTTKAKGEKYGVERNVARKVIASARGSYNPELLTERIKSQQDGNMGKVGEVSEISEPSLIEIMKAKAASLDFAKLKQDAIDRMYTTINQKDYDLAVATKTESKVVDLNYTLPTDIKDAKGRVIFPKGKVVNPLDVRMFTDKLVIFDPDDARQVKVAKAEAANSTKHTLLLMTQFPYGKTAKEVTDKINDLTKKTGRKVMLLTPELVERFKITASPCTIEQVGSDVVRKNIEVSL